MRALPPPTPGPTGWGWGAGLSLQGTRVLCPQRPQHFPVHAAGFYLGVKFSAHHSPGEGAKGVGWGSVRNRGHSSKEGAELQLETRWALGALLGCYACIRNTYFYALVLVSAAYNSQEKKQNSSLNMVGVYFSHIKEVQRWRGGWTVRGDISVFALPSSTPGSLLQGCLMVLGGWWSPTIISIFQAAEKHSCKTLFFRRGFPEVPCDILT